MDSIIMGLNIMPVSYTHLGITLHNINTAKFKTNLCAVFLTFPITYENATKDTLIALMLKRGSKNLKTRQEITSKLAELYGAEFDSGVDKSGDNHVLKFYLESLNEEYLPQKEDLLKKSIETLLELVFNPNIENGEFNKEFLEQEKNNLEPVSYTHLDVYKRQLTRRTNVLSTSRIF